MKNKEALSSPVICSGCGRDISKKQSYAFIRGELENLKPVFCSLECERDFRNKRNQGRLTSAALAGLVQWFAVANK